MKEKLVGSKCSVCGAEADGFHYGAISCRSCNAFFRRAVTFKQKYVCRRDGNCEISQQVRCTCRACRFNKCIAAGMHISAVQPRRDPTGSQKERRRPCRRDNSETCSSPSTITITKTIKEEAPPEPPEPHSYTSLEGPSSSTPVENAFAETIITRQFKFARENIEEEFESLIMAYREHQRFMQISLTTVDDFLLEPETELRLRRMMPTDVEKLSAVELSGLLYWIEKMNPFRHLTVAERTSLLKKYSVRKLSLDHFYHASKHVEMMKTGNFVMINNTYVPEGETGFEGIADDESTKNAQREVILPTIQRAFQSVLAPFASLHITDAEIVVLHVLLLWSVLNNSYVLEPTKRIMQKRREWAINALLQYYQKTGVEEPAVRLGEILLLLGEIEVIYVSL